MAEQTVANPDRALNPSQERLFSDIKAARKDYAGQKSADPSNSSAVADRLLAIAADNK